jgi:hypothetical protein
VITTRVITGALDGPAGVIATQRRDGLVFSRVTCSGDLDPITVGRVLGCSDVRQIPGECPGTVTAYVVQSAPVGAGES